MKPSSSPPGKRKKSSTSRKTPLGNGQTMESSQASEHPLDKDSMTSASSSNPNKQRKPRVQRKNKESATVESPPKAKKRISKGKSHTCNNSSQDTPLSQTSPLESTSNAKDCVPYWSSRARELSPKLWLPIETDCVALHSNWLNGSFNSMESNSWFSIHQWNPQNKQSSQKTCSQSLMFSTAESMEKESTKKTLKKVRKTKSEKLPANKSLKVRLKPRCMEQQNILKRWFGCVRYTYNWALSCIQSNPKEYQWNEVFLRKRFINECNISQKARFLLDTPKHVRDSAIFDLVDGYKVNRRKQTTDPTHTFSMKFRKKKETQSFTIPRDAIKNWNTEIGEALIYPTFLRNTLKFQLRKYFKTVITDIHYDCKMTMDTLGRFYLHIPYHYSLLACENQTCCQRWCSVDLGVRTFATIYSPTTNVCYKIGKGDISRIYRLCLHLDKLLSKHKIIRRKSRVTARTRNRIRNLVTEVHCKATSFLLQHFDNIVLPPFEVSNMVKRRERKISSQTVRNMLTWRFYGFRMRCLHTASLLAGKTVYTRGEEYTSKTCTHCQNVKHNLGGAKIYKCKQCGVKVDRDVAGARNIFMKNCVTC